MALKFYKTPHNDVIVKLLPGKTECEGPVEIKPNTTDAATEKHLPVVTVEGNIVTVNVSTVAHPMTEAHWIAVIAIETENGYQIAYLNPDNEPKAQFITDSKVLRAYEYCNLHGLWVTEL